MTNTTFHNGDVPNVQYSQTMFERGVGEAAHFFSSSEPKALVSFYNQNVPVVRRRCRCCRCRNLFTLSSYSPDTPDQFQQNLA